MARPGGSWYLAEGSEREGRTWAEGARRGSSVYEWAEAGGLQRALSRAARSKRKTRARPPASSQLAPSGFNPRPFWGGCHVHTTEPGLQALATGHAVTTPHLCHEQSLRCAPAAACEPGTYFSGESGQCVPCTPGTYQDGDGQLSCTPCPSSDGLGLAGARNVSECGGKCGPSLEGRRGGGVGTQRLRSPPEAPRAPVALREALHPRPQRAPPSRSHLHRVPCRRALSP